MDAVNDVFDLLNMHTSKILEAGHFEYRHVQTDGDGTSAVGFHAVCPDYHVLDRLGIVSVPFEAGLRHTGLAVLAWTTAFYDALRASSPDGFFNYPQHYLLYMVDDQGIVTESEPGTLTAESMKGWSHLDVWPDCKWVASPNSVVGMVEKLFDYEINRVLWPRSLSAVEGEGTLPDHVRRMLQTRLKGIYLYDSDSPTFEIHGAEPAVRLTREACEHAGLDASEVALPVESYERVDVDQFLSVIIGSVFDES